jgi:hypothetical protein
MPAAPGRYRILTKFIRQLAVKISSESLPAFDAPRHGAVWALTSDRREIIRNAWSARRWAEDRSAMIGLAVIRGLTLGLLGLLVAATLP